MDPIENLDNIISDKSAPEVIRRGAKLARLIIQKLRGMSWIPRCTQLRLIVANKNADDAYLGKLTIGDVVVQITRRESDYVFCQCVHNASQPITMREVHAIAQQIQMQSIAIREKFCPMN